MSAGMSGGLAEQFHRGTQEHRAWPPHAVFPPASPGRWSPDTCRQILVGDLCTALCAIVATLSGSAQANRGVLRGAGLLRPARRGSDAAAGYVASTRRHAVRAKSHHAARSHRIRRLAGAGTKTSSSEAVAGRVRRLAFAAGLCRAAWQCRNRQPRWDHLQGNAAACSPGTSVRQDAAVRRGGVQRRRNGLSPHTVTRYP